MSNAVNDQILEQIAEEVNEMSGMAIVNELGIVPIADSWDEFFAFADMEKLRWKLVLQRFENMGGC